MGTRKQKLPPLIPWPKKEFCETSLYSCPLTFAVPCQSLHHGPLSPEQGSSQTAEHVMRREQKRWPIFCQNPVINGAFVASFVLDQGLPRSRVQCLDDDVRDTSHHDDLLHRERMGCRRQFRTRLAGARPPGHFFAESIFMTRTPPINCTRISSRIDSRGVL